MKFDELEEQYLEALWNKLYGEIDEELDGQPEQQLEYLKLKYEIRRDKLFLDALKRLAKNTSVKLH